jgi:hypothetical protein
VCDKVVFGCDKVVDAIRILAGHSLSLGTDIRFHYFSADHDYRVADWFLLLVLEKETAPPWKRLK